MFRLHLVVKFTVCTRSSIPFPASPPPFLSPVCSYLNPPSGITPQKYIMFCTSSCVPIVVCPSREKRYVAKLTERTPIMHCACSLDDALSPLPWDCHPTKLHRCKTAELGVWGLPRALRIPMSLKSSKGWRLLHLLTFETSSPTLYWGQPAGSTHCSLFP